MKRKKRPAPAVKTQSNDINELYVKRFDEIMEPIGKVLKDKGIKKALVIGIDDEFGPLPMFVGSIYDAASLSKWALGQFRRKIMSELSDE